MRPLRGARAARRRGERAVPALRSNRAARRPTPPPAGAGPDRRQRRAARQPRPLRARLALMRLLQGVVGRRHAEGRRQPLEADEPEDDNLAFIRG